jgi:hypothetical protein
MTYNVSVNLISLPPQLPFAQLGAQPDIEMPEQMKPKAG